MIQLDLTKAKSKHIPTPTEATTILKYLKAHPTDEDAIPHLMKKYNCSEFSVAKIALEEIFQKNAIERKRKAKRQKE